MIYVSLATCGPASAIEPEHELGNWIGATSNLRFSDKWSMFAQGELRTWEMANNLNELLWRVSGRYDFSQRYRGEFGYVRVDTWPYISGELRQFYENRIYEEFLIKSAWGRAKVNHRFRLEQRWISTPEYGTEYSNRVRYMLDLKVPLSGDTIGPGTWYAKTFNEVFVDFDRNGYWFDLQGTHRGLNQNRLYAGIGRQITNGSGLTFGVLWQYRPNADFWRLVIGYSHNFDFRD